MDIPKMALSLGRLWRRPGDAAGCRSGKVEGERLCDVGTVRYNDEKERGAKHRSGGPIMTPIINRNGRIAGTRTSVYDIVHYLEGNRFTLEQIAHYNAISMEQFNVP